MLLGAEFTFGNCLSHFGQAVGCYHCYEYWGNLDVIRRKPSVCEEHIHLEKGEFERIDRRFEKGEENKKKSKVTFVICVCGGGGYSDRKFNVTMG